MIEQSLKSRDNAPKPRASLWLVSLAALAIVSLPAVFAPRANAVNYSYTGGFANGWANAGNWTPGGGPPGPGDTAVFGSAFTLTNQPNLTTGVTAGTLHMATGSNKNVTISADSPLSFLSLSGLGMVGTGVLVNDTGAFTLTITASVSVNNSQAWTNNSFNVFTVSGPVVLLNGNNLTVNGTGNTLISSAIASPFSPSAALTKGGSGTLTLTGSNFHAGGTTVNAGTVFVNNTTGSGTGSGIVTVNNSGTLGGTGALTGAVTVNAGGSIAPGNGGTSTAVLETGALTLASTSNFRININGLGVGTGFDQLSVTGGVTIGGSNLVVTVGTILSVGQTFNILTNDGADAISGAFAQGSTVTGSGNVFSINYAGGSGNDIVLTVIAPVPEPATWIGGALAIAGIAFTQRRRLRKVLARR